MFFLHTPNVVRNAGISPAGQSVYNPRLTNSFEKFIIFMKGYSTRNYVYRCKKCGFEAEYDDHAETLDRRRR